MLNFTWGSCGSISNLTFDRLAGTISFKGAGHRLNTRPYMASLGIYRQSVHQTQATCIRCTYSSNNSAGLAGESHQDS